MAIATFITSYAQASNLVFSCQVYTQNYQTYNFGQIILASNIETAPIPGSYVYASLSAAQRSSITQVLTNHCVDWGQNKLNSLSHSVLPVGGFATLSGAGYLWVQNGTIGYNIVAPTQYLYKRSLQPADACARLPYYKRHLCSVGDY
jgi:hypothetical protein